MSRGMTIRLKYKFQFIGSPLRGNVRFYPWEIWIDAVASFRYNKENYFTKEKVL